MPRFPSALAAPIAAALLLAGCFGLDPVPEKGEGGDGESRIERDPVNSSFDSQFDNEPESSDDIPF